MRRSAVINNINTVKYIIRPLETHADYYLAEEAQRTIWQMTDDTSVVPLHVLITTQKNAGLCAGAFDHEGHMIGFLFGFIGRTEQGHYKHCSHLMGVLPSLRRTGVGEALKRFQREYVLEQGIDLITWTYDPLEGVNAALNIGKLRTIARTYYENLYDEMADGLNAGIPTDRFEVEWWLNEPRVTQPTPPMLPEGALIINPTGYDATHEIALPGEMPAFDSQLSRTLLVEVPAVFQAVKSVSMALAREWRLHTRAIFERAFEWGYIVTDFVTQKQPDGHRRNFYVLEQEPPIPDG